MNKVQFIAIGVAVVLVAISIMVLTGVLPGLRSNIGTKQDIIMWGFYEEDFIGSLTYEWKELEGASSVKYIVKNLDTWETDLLNTLARGGVGAADAPDVLVFPSSYLQKHKDKLSAAPSALITEREIRQQFAESADVFLGAKGEVFGMPFYADALVLYWNKDIFTQNLITLPPKTWEEFAEISNKITKKDASGIISVSGAALGRGVNIKNSPAIISALFLQGGDKIIDESGKIVLGDETKSGDVVLRTAESALRFSSDFANPRKTTQSWAPSFPEAREAFIAQKLGMYVGFISEYNEIKSKNPHLNFAVSPLPQLQGASRPITGGILYALAVPKASQKQLAAWQFAKFLANSDISPWYADKTNNVSLRREVLPKYQRESVRSAFAEAALTLKLWPVPDPKLADQIFREMIEEVALERATLREAINKAKARLQQI